MSKRIFAIVTACALFVASSISVFATNNNATGISSQPSNCMEIAIGDATGSNGVTFGYQIDSDNEIFYYDLTNPAQAESFEALLDNESVDGDINAISAYSSTYSSAYNIGVVSVDIDPVGSKYRMKLTATGTQLTYVKGYMQCKSTSILFPTSYIDESFKVSGDGTLNNLHTSTSTFSIPSDVEKVKVGWHDVYITDVTTGTSSLADRSSTVTVANIS